MKDFRWPSAKPWLFGTACLFLCLQPLAAKHSHFSSKKVDGRLVEMKLTIPKDSGANSATVVYIRCQNNRTDMRFQFLRDFPADGTLTYFFPKRLAEGWTVTQIDGRQAEVASPTKFLKNWLSSGRFTLNSSAKGLTGSSEFSLSPYDVEGIYKIANACNWDDLVPAKGDALNRLNKANQPKGKSTGIEPSG